MLVMGSFSRRRLAAWTMALAVLVSAAAAASATTVRLVTSFGPLDIHLLDAEAPRTVANFLAYVNDGSFTNSIVHRNDPSFVIQGGGYTWTASNRPATIPAKPAVANEFGANRSNLRGTVAMARLGGKPDSATSEWFVNLANNSGLDTVDGGFTVFGRVSAPSMAVVDSIAAVKPYYAPGCLGPAFDEVPLINAPSQCSALRMQNMVMVYTATVLTAPTDADRVFNYIEALYPQHARPANTVSTTLAGYYLRYYAASGNYLGVANGQLYALVPSLSPDILPLGSVADWLATATAAGY